MHCSRYSVTLMLFQLALVFILLAIADCIERVDPSKVVIILSHGRSGSTEICGIVGNIVGGRVQGEIFGGNKDKMAAVSDPLALALGYLQQQQAENPGKVVGFKWKPYYHSAKYQKVWAWVSKNRVKVVYNYRNPLDVLISSSRAHEEDAVYNCKVGDKKCIQTQKALKTNLKLGTALEDLEALKIEGISMITHLSKHRIDYYDVTYEGLNHGSMTQRLPYLQGLADFLVPGRKATAADFAVHTEYIGNYHQNETLSNFKQLADKLRGTRFARYLH